MRLRRCIPGFLLLVAVTSCNDDGRQETESAPAVKLEVQTVSAFRAGITLTAVNCCEVRYNLSGKGAAPEFVSLEIDSPICRKDITLENLEPLSDYKLEARGIGEDGSESRTVSVDFTTMEGPSTLYSWEKKRHGVPSFADMSLVTMGWHNANPPAWTMDRFSSHVSYTDASGTPHWLFDCFLCIDGWDGKRGLSYSIGNGSQSATKESWEDLLDAWLGDDGALKQLDLAVSHAAMLELGVPPSPRYVVMSLPDPIRFQYFSDKNSSTKYWGQLNGRTLDFSSTNDQLAAYKWYMDSCRKRFNALGFKHLELAGFYILSEELPLNPSFYADAGQSYTAGKDDWNWQYKNWEILVPEVSAYAHSCVEGLWWIPYHLAPGYRVWRDLGFDCTFMQPNYYWDHDGVSHPLALTENALKTYRMGIELEFEYSLVASVMADGRSGPDGEGAPTFYLKDVPILRQRVRDYMDMYTRTGLYGQVPIAVYSGTDAWNQLATSNDPEDREMFLDICTFISESPLKK